MFEAVMLARYVIVKCIEDQQPINNIRLQEILYCIQRHFLKQNRVAFYDRFLAWAFGPVIPNVYYQFCNCGAAAIDIPQERPSIKMEPGVKKEIDAIIEEKRGLAPWDITRDTQRPGGAWHRAWNTFGHNSEITRENILKYG